MSATQSAAPTAPVCLTDPRDVPRFLVRQTTNGEFVYGWFSAKDLEEDGSAVEVLFEAESPAAAHAIMEATKFSLKCSDHIWNDLTATGQIGGRLSRTMREYGPEGIAKIPTATTANLIREIDAARSALRKWPPKTELETIKRYIATVDTEIASRGAPFEDQVKVETIGYSGVYHIYVARVLVDDADTVSRRNPYYRPEATPFDEVYHANTAVKAGAEKAQTLGLPLSLDYNISHIKLAKRFDGLTVYR